MQRGGSPSQASVRDSGGEIVIDHSCEALLHADGAGAERYGT